jgi:hypothetical protein
MLLKSTGCGQCNKHTHIITISRVSSDKVPLSGPSKKDKWTSTQSVIHNVCFLEKEKAMSDHLDAPAMGLNA